MSCPSGKIPYRDQREARKQLTRLLRRRAVSGTDRIEVGAYACPDCDAWHLTHLDQDWRMRRRHRQAIRQEQRGKSYAATPAPSTANPQPTPGTARGEEWR